MSGIVWLVCPLSEVKIILIREYEKGSVIREGLSPLSISLYYYTVVYCIHCIKCIFIVFFRFTLGVGGIMDYYQEFICFTPK
jgi:hypothetical protein